MPADDDFEGPTLKRYFEKVSADGSIHFELGWTSKAPANGQKIIATHVRPVGRVIGLHRDLKPVTNNASLITFDHVFNKTVDNAFPHGILEHMYL